jgi:hypothetical protein
LLLHPVKQLGCKGRPWQPVRRIDLLLPRLLGCGYLELAFIRVGRSRGPTSELLELFELREHTEIHPIGMLEGARARREARSDTRTSSAARSALTDRDALRLDPPVYEAHLSLPPSGLRTRVHEDRSAVQRVAEVKSGHGRRSIRPS